jgi:hypothetical protein
MRRWLAVLTVAVLICGSLANVCEKVQAKVDAKDGHHNSIVGDGVKINENNNVPYGQIKKAEDEHWSMGQDTILDGTSNVGALDGAIAGGVVQVADLDSQILGGHHNSIVLESDQVAGVSGISSEGLVQGSYIDSLIDGGHHNLIFVDVSQIALADGSASISTSDSSSSGLIQMADVSGQIVGGHHNTIVVGSLQAFEVN